MFLRSILLFVGALIPSAFSSHSCLDENNYPVDWFAIYKIPKLEDNSNPLIKDGMGYAYTSSNNDHGWILSKKSINDTPSIPGLTLSFFYDVASSNISEDTLYILYNDQPPNGAVSFTGGHTKGVVVADESGGFWLVHSVPHYPPPPESAVYSYPYTGLRNGQSFLCITLKPHQLETVGLQLMYNDPNIFANSTPAALKAKYPLLTKAALGSNVTSPPYYHDETITSAQGTVFHSFAKTPKFNKDLYADWVAVALQTNLLVETWPNGPGRLNSSCDYAYSVENVEAVNISVAGESFHSTKDHSKWAISESKDRPWVCIGDINRAGFAGNLCREVGNSSSFVVMPLLNCYLPTHSKTIGYHYGCGGRKTQAVRGGGTVCVSDPQLWRAYFTSISSVQSCPKLSAYLV